MHSLADLLQRHCRHLDGPAMATTAIAAQLAVLPQWRLEDGVLVRAFLFGNYYETLAFVNALAYVVHREDHHPDLTLSYNRCVVRFNTHSVGGISENDFICAAKADAVFAQQFGTAAE
jgi:4a-hydroxytetrahydrobiopterin dehydratase